MRTTQAPVRPANFSELLVATRAAARLSQEALAERSGLSVRAISDLERGRVARPRRSSVELLATALGLAGGPLRDFLLAAGHAVAQTPEQTVSASLCTLPSDAGVLVGREADLAAIGQRAGTEPAVVVVSGQPGVGKTSLAVAAGHQLADEFPDGQFFVSLRGTDASPVPPAEVLARLLTALGCGGTIPPGTDERLAVYHALLRRRRMLLILDNAVDESQVRPLLPAGACLTLVTSRSRLAGVPATERLFLDVLTDDHAADMLARIVGPARCAAEPSAVRQLIAHCGRLPLALRVAANRLASRPHWTMQRLVERLGDQHRRLDELTAGDLTVRGPFEVSYEQLGPRPAALFRRLPLLAGADFDATLAGSLIDVDAHTADSILDELMEASLVEPAGPDRYRLHDLVKLFAARKLDEIDPPVQREDAADRLARFVLTTAIRAGAYFELDDFVVARLRRWRGGHPLPSRAEAAHWLAIESAHWLAALERAAAQGWRRMVVDAGEAMHWYSDTHFHHDVWPRVFGLAAAAARAGELRSEEVAQRNYLGWARHHCQGRPEEAMAEHQAALELALAVDDPRWQAWSWLYIGSIRYGDSEGRAVAACRTAVDLISAVDDPVGAAMTRQYLGATLYANDQHAEADEHLQLSEMYWRSRLRRDGPDGVVATLLAGTVLWRSRCLVRLGLLRDAVRLAEEAVARFRAQNSARGSARALLWAAELQAQAGDLTAALTHLNAATEVSALLGATRSETESLLTAADLYDRIGDRERATATRDRARAPAARIGIEQGRRLRDRAGGTRATTAR